MEDGIQESRILVLFRYDLVNLLAYSSLQTQNKTDRHKSRASNLHRPTNRQTNETTNRAAYRVADRQKKKSLPHPLPHLSFQMHTNDQLIYKAAYRVTDKQTKKSLSYPIPGAFRQSLQL